MLLRGWRLDPVAKAGLAWLAGVVAVLSAAAFKRADYLLPAYPGAAIFLGCWLEGRLAGVWRPRLLTATAAVMVAGWAVRLGWSLPGEEPYRDYRPFAAVVRGHASTAEVVFFRAEAHALAFRVGQPLAQLVEWPRLQQRLRRPGEHWVVTRPPVVGARSWRGAASSTR
jgi:hypothetical protein